METNDEVETPDGEHGETVYDNATDDNHVMSERVQSLASAIYNEFERMIRTYDEDVVKELMPLVVGILEGMDNVLLDKQEKEVDLELLRDDNEQLITQYEREKQLRKSTEQKLLELDDTKEEEQKEMESKIESMESLLRMFELKAKNAHDHITRLDDKESDMRKEYAKLHERYTELFKTHVDHMERTKMLMGGERIMEMAGSPMGRGQGFHTPALKPVNASLGLYPTADAASVVDTPTTTEKSITSPQSVVSNVSLHSEFQQAQNSEADSMTTKQQKDSQNKSNAQNDKNLQEIKSDNTEETRKVSQCDSDSLLADSSYLTDNSDILSPEELPPHEDQCVSDIVSQPAELETFDEMYSSPASARADGSVEQNSVPVANRNENSLFTEMRHDDSHTLGAVDITGKVVHPGEYSSAGVGKEVENLILENTELLATKNALNVVKDDLIVKVDELQSEQEIQREEITSLQAMKTRLKTRMSELEDELKKTKEDLEKQKEMSKTQQPEDDDVPMAQRKRFTRVEMARVLMERNQYKERLMELQEAVRYTEMIRASREHPELTTKKKGSIWNFFGNLFATPDKKKEKQLPSATIKYSAATTNVRPVGDPNKKNRDKYIGDKNKAYTFLQDDVLSEKCRREREQERKEQYKQVRAHVKKDDGRMQAYGWSLPAKFTANPNGNDTKQKEAKSHVPVPVPVYCHPLVTKEPGIKLWCAAGVTLTGGVTPDGGSVIGASVFYTDTQTQPDAEANSVEKLDQELNDNKTTCSPTVSSSLVWICTTSTNHNSSMLIIDANKPAQILDSFTVGSSHILCVTSVPGAIAEDYNQNNDSLLSDIEMSIEDQQDASQTDEQSNTSQHDLDSIKGIECATADNSMSSEQGDSEQSAENPRSSVRQIRNARPIHQLESSNTPAPSGDDNEKSNNDGEPTNNSISPTMWLGAQSGSLYVHSAIDNWKQCLHSVKLKDSVLSIIHVQGRVIVALANGTVAVFHRDKGGNWDLSNYHIVDLGKPAHSIRCLCVVANKYVWCGHRNKIHVLDPHSLSIQKCFAAHPRKESQIRQLAWIGDGVWVSIRLDSTLRLYHAFTHQHLQDVDIEPYVSKMLGTGKLGFSFVRITSLMVSCSRLWIGTGNGVIISVPLSESNRQTVTGTTTGRPGGIIRVYSDTKTGNVTPGSFIPYCSMAQAQLSFHGHKDAVKFFVAVAGASKSLVDNEASSSNNNSAENASMLLLSGGEGYVDFRIGDVEESADEKPVTGLSKGDRSHLIVWSLANR